MAPPLDMPALNCYGPISPPSSNSASISSGYELFGDCSLYLILFLNLLIKNQTSLGLYL